MSSPEVFPEPDLGEVGAGAGGGGEGFDERRIARGALLQQASQVWGTACMLLVATLLGRRLSLDAFGVYGLLISLVAYLVTVQVSVEGAAVRMLSEAEVEPSRRAEVLSTTMAIYAVGGVVAAALVASAGVALVGVLGIPDDLQEDARHAVLALAAITVIGWPFKAFQDALRGMQLFGAAAAAEMAAYGTMAAGMTAAVLLDAPLWVIVAIGGSLAVMTGLWALVSLRVFRVGLRFHWSEISWPLARRMLRVSAYLFVAGLADLVVYSLDRVILAAFRSTASVGLYEGAARPHNLIRQLNGTLVLTVVPVASRYIAEGDDVRLRELLVRGTRYVAAIVAPTTVVLIVLAAPLLDVWLGDRYRTAALALALLSSYWLIGCATGVLASMVVAAGRVRFLARYAWVVAISNLAVSLALTPSLGLDGVVLGTTVPYLLAQPWFLVKASHGFGVSLGTLVRSALAPAYTAAAVVALVLVPIRLFAEPQNLLSLVASAVGALALGWGVLWFCFLTPGERRLVASMVPGLAPRA
ncbi:MAG TPA: oligosaccharide flippase family protein [Baekduia sp.]|uniref:oligosaccharide flippase family protein n=1 Tax=Baekduia sp. TaxID=2600305 RepID=UPI002BB5752B|nr:oligosaccharide flippase family protein [Baekduia sp.]HMJ36453.1 oligosaccharide flippase family protein [Baekduia sp.]